MKRILATALLGIGLILALPFYFLGTFIAFIAYGTYMGFKESWNDMKNL